MRKRSSNDDSKAVHARRLRDDAHRALVQNHGRYAEDAWEDYRRPAFWGTNLEAGKLHRGGVTDND